MPSQGSSLGERGLCVGLYGGEVSMCFSSLDVSPLYRIGSPSRDRHCMFLLLGGTSVQFSSDAQSCPTLHDPMNHSMPALPVHHQLPEATQNYVHRVGDPIQPSHPLSSPSAPALNLSQHQGLFQVSSSHQVAKVLEFQLQHQSFQ